MVSAAPVRPATAGDARAVADVHVASLRDTYDELLGSGDFDTLDSGAWTRAWTARLAGGDGCLLVVTEHGDRVAGFAWLGPTTDPDDDPQAVGQLRSIHVLPRARGTGLGRALLDAVHARLLTGGAREATLWVVDGNTRALGVYERDGWRADGASREDALAPPGGRGPQARVIRLRRPLVGDALLRPRVPKYYAVKQLLRRRIEGSSAGTALPPERALSEEFGTSRGTIRQALLELAVEGMVVRLQGRGTFVAPPKDTLPLRLRSYTEEWRSRDRRPGARLLDVRTEPAEVEVAEQLRVAPGTAALRLERLRLTDDIPMALEIAYLQAERFGSLAEHIAADVSLYALLRRHWDIEPHAAVETIETILASPMVAAVLETDSATPMLLLTRTTEDRSGQPFEFVRSVYRGDRYRFATTLSPT